MLTSACMGMARMHGPRGLRHLQLQCKLAHENLKATTGLSLHGAATCTAGNYHTAAAAPCVRCAHAPCCCVPLPFGKNTPAGTGDPFIHV